MSNFVYYPPYFFKWFFLFIVLELISRLFWLVRDSQGSPVSSLLVLRLPVHPTTGFFFFNMFWVPNSNSNVCTS